MKIFLSIACGFMLLFALTFQVSAKDNGKGKGHRKGNGHNKHYYKKQKHYCGAHCHGAHHVYPKKVIIVQPVQRPGININLPL